MKIRRVIRGFSLIELIVVIGIIAILTSLVMPAVGNILGSQKIGQAGSVFVGALSGARQLAVTRGLTVSVWLVGTNTLNISGALTVIRLDNGTNEMVGRLRRLPDATTVSTVSALSPVLDSFAPASTNSPGTALGATYYYRAIEFRPDGSLSATNTNIFLTVVPERDIANAAPPNFTTIALDRRSGAVRSLRP